MSNETMDRAGSAPAGKQEADPNASMPQGTPATVYHKPGEDSEPEHAECRNLNPATFPSLDSITPEGISDLVRRHSLEQLLTAGRKEHIEVHIDERLSECDRPWFYHFATDKQEHLVWNGRLNLAQRRRILESASPPDPQLNDSEVDDPWSVSTQLYEDLPRIAKMLGIEWLSDRCLQGDVVGTYSLTPDESATLVTGVHLPEGNEENGYNAELAILAEAIALHLKALAFGRWENVDMIWSFDPGLRRHCQKTCHIETSLSPCGACRFRGACGRLDKA